MVGGGLAIAPLVVFPAAPAMRISGDAGRRPEVDVRIVEDPWWWTSDAVWIRVLMFRFKPLDRGRGVVATRMQSAADGNVGAKVSAEMMEDSS